MDTQRTDQPSNVSTEDAPRPQDEHVVTSDVISEPGKVENEAASAASGEEGKKPDPAPNDPDSATGDDDNSNTAPKRGSRKLERKIKRMSKRLAEYEANNAELREKLAALEAEAQALKSRIAPPEEPKLEDFEDPREYAKAYAKWESESTAPAATPNPAQTPTAPPPPQDASPIPDEEILAFQQRGKEKLGDEFLEALHDGAPVNQVMGEYLLDSDFGPELYVHLANNPEEARKIYDSSAPRAVRMLKALEDKAKAGGLDAGDGISQESGGGNENKSGTGSGAGRKATRAPTPPSDTKPGGAPNLAPNPDTEDMDAYAARRRKEEARKMGLNV